MAICRLAAIVGDDPLSAFGIQMQGHRKTSGGQVDDPIWAIADGFGNGLQQGLSGAVGKGAGLVLVAHVLGRTFEDEFA